MLHLGHVPKICFNLQSLSNVFAPSCIPKVWIGEHVTISRNVCCSFAFRPAHAEPHQEVVGGAAARAHANTTILDYGKMLPEIMHQSLSFGPFGAYGSMGALC